MHNLSYFHKSYIYKLIISFKYDQKIIYCQLDKYLGMTKNIEIYPEIQINNNDLSRNELKNQSNQSDKKTKQKIQQNIVAYWGMNFMTLLVAFSAIPLFTSTDSTYYFSLCFIQFGLIVPLTIYICYKYTESKCHSLKFFILLDSIVLAYIIGMSGFITIGVLLPLYGLLTIYSGVLTSFFTAFNHFLLIGNFRIILANCQWKKYQFISTKISLLIAILCYLVLTIFFMVMGSPKQSQVIDKIKDIIFLYVFGFLAINQEIYTKLTNLDGTQELKVDYQSKQDPEVQNFTINQNSFPSQNNLKSQQQDENA